MSAQKHEAIQAAAVMSTLADELDRMRGLGLRIEGSLCALAGEVASQGEWMEDLQQFDLLLQQLGALRDFLGKVAVSTGAEAPLDIGAALAGVTLDDLRVRLGGAPQAQSEGALLFFDEADAS